MNESKPRVSIGLPVYNGENYLASTIESILAQTYPDFELIIADNASTDRTAEICQQYAEKDARVRYERHTQNLGAAKNYNYVFHVARGEYFKWVAHDDPLAPDALARCVDALDAHPEVIMAYPRTILIDGQGEVIEFHKDGFHLMMDRPCDRLRQAFSSSAWCHPVFGLVRTDVLGKTGLIGSYPSSDKVLLAEFAIVGKCFEVPEHLAYRRLHEQISTEVNQTDEDMAAWFDPQAKHVVTAPRWRRLWEIHKAILRSPHNFGERLHCYFVLMQHYIAPTRFRGALRDLAQIVRRGSRTVGV